MSETATMDATLDGDPQYLKYIRALRECEGKRAMGEMRATRSWDKHVLTDDTEPENMQYTLYRFEKIIKEFNDHERRHFYSAHDVDDYHREVQFIRETFKEQRIVYSLYSMDEALDKLKQLAKRLKMDWKVDHDREYNDIADMLMRVLIDVEHRLVVCSEKGGGSCTSTSSIGRRDGAGGGGGGGGGDTMTASMQHILHRLEAIEDTFATEKNIKKLNDAALHRLYKDIYHIHRALRRMHLTQLEKVQNIELRLRYAKMGMLRINDYLQLSREVRDFRYQLEALYRSDIIEDDERHKRLVEFANENLASLLKEENVLELSLKQVYDKFVLTWHKIFLELLDPSTYRAPAADNRGAGEADEAGEAGEAGAKEWWQEAYRIVHVLLGIFTKQDRMIYVGIGLLIASFFSYYLTLSA